jgi:thermolabile hemolysin
MRPAQLLVAVVALGFLANRAAAGPFSDLVVFGDSLSDVGNISQATPIFPFVPKTPGPYYWNGRFSNGPVYAETLATGLGLPAIVNSSSGGNDYAFGGAQTTGTGGLNALVIKDVDDQVSQFTGSRNANATTLYVIFAGANDLINGQTNMSVPVNSLSTSLGQLVTDGARKLLVINLPPLGYTPRYNGSQSTRDQYNSRSQQFNSSLTTMLDSFQTSNPSVTLYRFDVAALFNQAVASPSAFGLTNVSSPAAPGLQPGATSYDTTQIATNVNQYLFWDDLHPTKNVHAIVGQRVLDLFRLPGDFDLDNADTGSDYTLWRKGFSASHIPDDYNVWRTHFGQVSGSGNSFSASAIPEPSALALFAIAAAVITLRSR